jgi:hypothetical protein
MHSMNGPPTTESVAAMAIRLVIRLGRIGIADSFNTEQLIKMARLLGEKIPRETMEELLTKLEEIENELPASGTDRDKA